MFSCKVAQIKNVILWGNHSRKQYCDISNVQIEGFDEDYVREKLKQLDFHEIEKIMYERGGFILEKANGNAYISATKAIIDHLRDWFKGSDRTVSMGVVMGENLYGIPAGLCFSLPTVCVGNGEYKVIGDMELNEYQRRRIDESREELLKERGMVQKFLLQ